MTGQPTALARAQVIRTALLDHGVPQVSIELQVGRPTYGSYGGDDWNACKPVAVFAHHTVSGYSASSLTPVLWLCKAGRSDVPGPLCNGYGGWDLCYRIVTTGMANHPGEGGPYTVQTPRGAFTMPLDSARAWAWGTEYEGGLSGADWDRMLTNPPTSKKMTFREFMGRSEAGLLQVHGLDARAHLEHKTWAPTRKIDRLNYTTDSGRAEATRYANPSQEDDMQDADFDRIKTIVAGEVGSLRNALSAFRANVVDRDAAAAARDAEIAETLARVEAGHMDASTREQVRRLREALMTKLKETPA